MNILVFLRACLLALVAVIAVAGPVMADTEQGVVVENLETGERVWIPDEYWIGINNGADPEALSAARAHTGCTGVFDMGIFGNCTATSMTNRAAADDGVEEFYNRDSGTIVQNYNERGSWALIIFDYATGASGSSCITCDFMAYFMSGLTDFSKAVYAFFVRGFLMLVPLMLTIWIGYRVAKMVTFGGEDGKAFIYSVIQKLSLFVVIFLLFSASDVATGPDDRSTDVPYAWNLIGPEYAQFAFDLSGTIRNESIRPIAAGLETTTADDGKISPFGCAAVAPASISGESANIYDRYEYIRSGVEVSCVTERTHIIGISTGLAVMFSSWNTSESNWNPKAWARATVNAINKIVIGTMMLAIYLMSAVWLIFLTLDIVVRVMITAAFSPVIGGLFMWQPTRGMATNAIKAFFGSAMTAVALSIVSVLALYLMTNTLSIYDALWETVKEEYPDTYRIEAIPETGLAGMREFISRTQETDPDYERIPMDWSTPWLFYIYMVGLAVFALGKKIIKMLEQVLDYEGMSAFADSATKNFKTAAMGSMVGAGITGWVAKRGAGMGIGGLGLVGGAGYAAGTQGMSAAGGFAKDFVKKKFGGNPFGNTEKASLDNALAKAAKVKMGSGAVKGTLEQADEE